MGSSENSPGVINIRETPSAADAAVALVETLIDGCVDREVLRKKFMERFGGDRHAARTYFSLALRRLANAGEVVIMKSGESEVICRGKEPTEVIKEWGDLIDVLTWRGKEIDPDARTNGRIITYLVRHGMLKALAAFLCRGAKMWAYIDDPVDLSLVLGALRYVIPPHNISSSVDIEPECTCPNSDFAAFVPRRTLLTYMATTMDIERDVENFVDINILKLPGGQTVSLRNILTDCMRLQRFGGVDLGGVEVLLQPLIFRSDRTLPLIIRFVRVVD